MREALHPLDQFRAFKALREQGTSEDEIAARFFVTPSIVKQRLRLASVSEALLEVYAEDGMTLDQLMAFSVSSDHARQEQVWADVGQTYANQPYNLRRLLTDEAVPVSDRRARYVGIAAYEEAGGTIMRDLFTVDQGGWMQDVALLDRLVSENLSETAHAIAKEGWKWIEAATDLPYGHEFGYRRITGTVEALSEVDQAACDVLMAEFDELTGQYDGGDDLPEEVDARLGELETAIDGYLNRPATYDKAEMARAGVFISLAGNGVLRIDRGYVRAEDEPVVDAETGELADNASAVGLQQPNVTIGGSAFTAEPVEEEDDVIRPLPERLVTELTAERTLALRNALRVGTPWGTSQQSYYYADGILCHSTAGHGGFHLGSERNAMVHAMWRNGDGWYEEDAEWAKVAFSFPRLFTTRERRCAAESLRNDYPDVWEHIHGVTLAPGESRVKDERQFRQRHAADWVVVSAIRSDRHPGFVECVAKIGGNRSLADERLYLVPGHEYQAGRFGFVIDEREHQRFEPQAA